MLALPYEIRRPVVGYEGLYEVSNMGNVISLKRFANVKCGGKRIVRQRPLRSWKDKNGYLSVNLSIEGINKTAMVYRIVISSFISNIYNKPTVNHKNGVKDDNRLENLERATYYEQERHARDILGKRGYSRGGDGILHKHHLYIKQYTLDGVFISNWNSMAEAGRAIGIKYQGISNCCMGKQKTTGGYKREYFTS